MQGDQIRERLHSGECVYGTHIAGLSNPKAMSMMTKAGLDFAFFCAEHMPLDRSEISTLCHLFAAKGISPIVRIPYPSARLATIAVEGGAQGVVAPYIETVEQVREVVSAMRYRPIKGKLLAQFLSGERKPKPRTIEFLNDFNRHNYTIIGIESVAAYENLDALIGVDGVDGVFVGPHDMTVSLEVPLEWNNPELHRIFDDIVVRCHAANVGVGVHMSQAISSIEQIRHLIGLGMNWVLDGADVALAMVGFRERRAALGLPEQPAPSEVRSPSVSSCLIPSEGQAAEKDDT